MIQNPLPVAALIGLALLAVPRVVLHDLGLLHAGSALNAVLAVGPPLIWIAVVLWRRDPRPFLTLLAVGAIHAVLLALTHQLLWGASFAGSPPRLGGNLSGVDDDLQSVIVRSFAVLSSLVTGITIGAITGLAAWFLSRLRRDQPPDR